MTSLTSATTQRYHLLVVDDVVYFLMLINHEFSHAFEVSTACSATEALKCLDAFIPDLILLDVDMPEIDGYTLFSQLKQKKQWADIPVIFVTGHDEGDGESRGLTLGAADYITKPINFEIAHLRIDNLLERERMRKELLVQRNTLKRQLARQKQAERQLRLAASVFRNSYEGIIIAKVDGTIIDVNQSFEQICGFQRAEVLERNILQFKNTRHDSEFYQGIIDNLHKKGHWYGDIWHQQKNHEWSLLFLAINCVLDDYHQTSHYVALFTDVTLQREHEKQLELAAHYDLLTALPNRKLFADRLQQAIHHALRLKQKVAVAYIDLDGFKSINDQHGHKAGDQLLVTLASRMKHALRESDTLARLGGDEFVAVLVDLTDTQTCIAIIERLLNAAAQPFEINGLFLQVSASVGITFYPQIEEIDADQLLRQADQAMYQAKLAGKNRYHLFDPEIDRHLRGQHASIYRIKQALEHHQFVLFYQPKVNLKTQQVIGVEALIRWEHPEDGLIMPSVFLPTIENHPLSVSIGEWVIQAAIEQLSAWGKLNINLPISINIGARQLQQTDFMDKLRGELQHAQINPNLLELEILETSALEDLEQASRVIEQCRHLGIRLALDDFGTGYSSLTYLKRLQVNQLKIDQSFVRDMLDDPEDLAILKAVIALASALKREVIAEGVESAAHAHRLLQLGCELAQGYWVARPMPAAAILTWLSSWPPAADIELVNHSTQAVI